MTKLRTILCIVPLLFMSAVPVSAENDENDGNDPDVRILQDEIVYHILVDLINSGNQSLSDQVDLDDPYACHGGDLQGITDMLQELDSQGFTAVTLSPLMENPENG